MYKKKGETIDNEVADDDDFAGDDDKPQTTRGSRGDRGGRGGRGGERGGADRGVERGGRGGERGDRGSRGGRGGRGGRGDRPETEGGDRRGGQNRERNDNFKETYYYKFHYERPPQWEKFDITLTTELQPMPKKEDRLKDPDQKAFEEQMSKLDRQVDDLKKKIKEFSQKKKDKIEGKKQGPANMTVGEEFRE